MNINEKKYKNFDTAYKAITNKLIKNSMNNTLMRPAVLLTDHEIEKHRKELEYRQRKDNGKSVYERLYTSNTRKVKDYIQHLEQDKLEKQQKEERFIPKTNKSKFDSKRRSVNDFLDDMRKFSTRKDMKIEEEARQKYIIETKMVNSYFDKKGNRSRSPDLSKINNLYNNGVKKQLQRSISPQSIPQDRNVGPKINKISRKLHRNMNVSEILYDDANKRRLKMSERRKSNYSSINSSSVFNEKKNTSYMVSKISKELENVCVYNSIHIKDAKIDLTQLVNIMTDMKYISSPITQVEKSLVGQAWEVLRGEELNGISTRNLLFFLIGIHKLKINQIFAKPKDLKTNKPENPSMSGINEDKNSLEMDCSSIRVSKIESIDVASSINDNPHSYINNIDIGCFDKNEKFFFKDEADQMKAYKIFAQLIQRKASKAKCSYFIGANPDPVDRRFSYKPQINEKPNQFEVMDKSNSRILSMNMRSASSLRPEQLLKKGEDYKKNIAHKREIIRNEEMKECTFKPFTNSPVALKKKNENRYDVILTSDDEPILKKPSYGKVKKETISTSDLCKDNFKRHLNQTFESSLPSGGYADDQGNGKKLNSSSLDDYLVHKTRPSKNSEERKSISSDSPELPVSNIARQNEIFEREEAPILFLDVNFGNNKMTRIVMYKGK